MGKAAAIVHYIYLHVTGWTVTAQICSHFDILHCLAGIIKLFPARESLVSDIPAGDEKIANLFYSVLLVLWTRVRSIFLLYNVILEHFIFAHIKYFGILKFDDF